MPIEDAMQSAARDPAAIPLMTWAWVIIMSSLGGLASFFREVRKEERRWNLRELLGEICISWFVGVTTFFLCDGYSVDPMLTAGLVGVCAHMGSRGIFFLERLVMAILEHRAGVKVPPA